MMIRKWLVVGIIFLLPGINLLPSITAYIMSDDDISNSATSITEVVQFRELISRLIRSGNTIMFKCIIVIFKFWVDGELRVNTFLKGGYEVDFEYISMNGFVGGVIIWAKFVIPYSEIVE